MTRIRLDIFFRLTKIATTVIWNQILLGAMASSRAGENIKVAVRVRELNEREVREGGGESWKCMSGSNISSLGSAGSETGVSYTYGACGLCYVRHITTRFRSRVCPRLWDRGRVRRGGPRDRELCAPWYQRHPLLLRTGEPAPTARAR